MKKRSNAAMGSTYRAVVCLSGGLLLTGLVPASAIAQVASNSVEPESVQAEIAPAASPIVATSGNRPRLLNRRAIPRFSIDSKPSLSKPNRRWPTVWTEPTAPQEETVQLVLRVDERRVYVYRGDRLAASYPVAVGRDGWETPTGSFEVFSTVEEPGWTNPFTNEAVPPGEGNPLGDRWIAFWTDGENMIGFHGTPNRDSVGKAASHGCVRMYNEHIRELFELVDVGTPVTVVL